MLWAAVGCALIVLGLTLDFAPISLSLAAGSTMGSILLALIVLEILGLDPVQTVKRTWIRLFPPSIGIWRFDLQYGYRHAPGAVGRHILPDRTVTYTIDGGGFRVTPDPLDSKGRIVCLGCSFSFGWGVEDSECYPHVLGTKYWNEFKIRNRAVSGWGTVHAFLALQDELTEQDPPRLVLYGWIPNHRMRNFIRRGWVSDLQRGGLRLIPWNGRESEAVSSFPNRKHPHFELEKGRLVFKGVVGEEDLAEDPPDLIRKEIDLTRAFLREMNGRTRERSIPFIVIALPIGKVTLPDEARMDQGVPEYVQDLIAEEGLPWLDASSADRGSIPGDGHPNAATHATLADFIATSTPVLSLLNPSAGPEDAAGR